MFKLLSQGINDVDNLQLVNDVPLVEIDVYHFYTVNEARRQPTDKPETLSKEK